MCENVGEEEIVAALNKHIDEEKLNWAEVTEVAELYSICDRASADFDGLPDSLLKPAMLVLLEQHFTASDSEWLREHLQGLIQSWQREVDSERHFPRASQVIMAAPEYQPFEVIRRKRTKENSKSGRMMMGVGALLQSVAAKPMQNVKISKGTEETVGEVEKKEEKTEGLPEITHDGQELSWEFWANFSGSSETVAPAVAPPPPKPERAKTPQMDYHDYKKFKKAQHERRMGQKKLKLMDKVRKEMEEFERQEEGQRMAAGADVVETEPKEKKKRTETELDEGEIDSEEERQMIKAKRVERGSSSSEGSSSDEEQTTNSRRRRSKMRKDKVPKDENAIFNNRLLSQMYAFRHRLIFDMPLNQKRRLARLLEEMVNSPTT